jgi:hypothetical protein
VGLRPANPELPGDPHSSGPASSAAPPLSSPSMDAAPPGQPALAPAKHAGAAACKAPAAATRHRLASQQAACCPCAAPTDDALPPNSAAPAAATAHAAPAMVRGRALPPSCGALPCLDLSVAFRMQQPPPWVVLLCCVPAGQGGAGSSSAHRVLTWRPALQALPLVPAHSLPTWLDLGVDDAHLPVLGDVTGAMPFMRGLAVHLSHACAGDADCTEWRRSVICCSLTDSDSSAVPRWLPFRPHEAAAYRPQAGSGSRHL